MAALQGASDDFSDKLVAASSGGKMHTAAKNYSRDALIVLLRQTAGYVQLHCNNDFSTLLGSGFQAASTNRSQTPLDQPKGLNIKNGNSGQLIASVKPVKIRVCTREEQRARTTSGCRAHLAAIRAASSSTASRPAD